jgi:tetratricopeptide (TPR) repeat protein
MWNRERRLVVLATVLLMALGYLLVGPDLNLFPGGTDNHRTAHQILPGNSEIMSVTLLEVAAYHSKLEIEYFYNGSAGPYTTMRVDIPVTAGNDGYARRIQSSRAMVSPGRNKVTMAVYVQHSPQDVLSRYPQTQTQTVKVAILGQDGEAMVSRDFDQVIDWPSSDRYSLSSNKPEEIERLYKLCVETIDAEIGLENAKRGLEQILLAKPDYVPAYTELARYQMKTNWSPDGLLQAEQSLKTALRLDAKHANTLVLIGYVYAHQHRYKDAEEALRKAESIDSRNIWLYSNWGDLRSLEGKRREAIEKYQKAVVAPVSFYNYERARIYAYEHLLAILTEENRWPEVDALYQQRIAKYPDNGCYKADYAGFQLARHGDYENAIAIGGKALAQQCHDNRIDGRLILAMAYYTKWARLSGSNANARETDQFFNRGQALYSDMPGLLYSLARSPRTVIVIPALKRRGVGMDTPDREGVSALGHSILKHDIEAGQALIRHGANINQGMNPDGMTPLMLAASRGDHAFVAMLLKNGADRKLRTRSGYTAERIAAESGFKEIAAQLAAPSGV